MLVSQRSLPLAALAAALFGFAPLASAETADGPGVELQKNQRVALIGNSTAERMNLFGHFEARLHRRFPEREIVFRNFGWPADEVDERQRPGNYTVIDDPYLVFSPDLVLCFFGLNESFEGDSAEQIETFKRDYATLLDQQHENLDKDGSPIELVLVSPMAFESTGNPLQPNGEEENRRLKSYRDAVEELAEQRGLAFVDLFTPTAEAFAADEGAQFTINGIHANENGDRLIAEILERELFGDAGSPLGTGDGDLSAEAEKKLREVANDKSWLHLQDYRMLNGWYVYGGRRTWDTETFPTEFRKIRKMVDVRDRYLWDLASGRDVPDKPDDSETGEVFIPETMFGSRDDNFRSMREPTHLEYPTPDESIDQMTMPEGFRVECFASEADFPELANPTQIAFDGRNRLWVACMVNYPQWLPGKAKPDDRLLIFEDTDGDGKADTSKVFYDKLICPTGFEFYKDGVLVVDEPRILFLRDTDGDDVADQVTHLIDGIGTDDTHHAMGAWEYSPGGKLHMLEGIAMSTTIETPYGVKREEGASGAYVWDVDSLRMRHFKTPGHYNPWCLVFDRDGNGIIGDGTNANQHWANLLSGGEVATRASVDAIFNNHGLRPAAGNELLNSRVFPEEYHNQLIYACVINMHGFPSFKIRDDAGSCGLTGERTEDLLSSTDMFFRPVDPKIGPDGALWFGDWCNALIGHMQYSQRDPNRDHEHGRIYRMVHADGELIKPLVLADASIERLLEELTAFEPRTRYRVRRELRRRDQDAVLAAVKTWADESSDPTVWREALWMQEHFHAVDANLVRKVYQSGEPKHRAAAVHTVGNESRHIGDAADLVLTAAQDDDARVRLEAARAASLLEGPEAMRAAMTVASKKTDKWIDYVLMHTFQTLQPTWESAETIDPVLASVPAEGREYFEDYRRSIGPGSDVYGPLKVMVDVDAQVKDKDAALAQVVAAKRGDPDSGKVVFNRVCASCHMHGEMGKKFGPNLTDLGDRMTKEHIIRSIVWPNEEIAKGYETVMVLDWDGVTTNGFILSEDDEKLVLGIADGKQKEIDKEDIEIRKEMKASSMPEGLTETIAPSEFLDLIAFLGDGWIATNPNLDYNLQERDGFKEVSRQTHIRLPEGAPAERNQEAEHLLSHEGVRAYPYAIFTAEDGTNDNNDVLIRFNDPTEIRRVAIFNRKDGSHARAKGLTFWISDDAKDWKEVWKSEEAYPEFGFALPEGTTAKYAKIGLDRDGVLHLDRMMIYGNVLQDQSE